VEVCVEKAFTITWPVMGRFRVTEASMPARVSRAVPMNWPREATAGRFTVTAPCDCARCPCEAPAGRLTVTPRAVSATPYSVAEPVVSALIANVVATLA